MDRKIYNHFNWQFETREKKWGGEREKADGMLFLFLQSLIKKIK